MNTLIDWRTKKAMSQRDLAQVSGVALSTISHIKSGKHKATFVTRRKLAFALGLKPEEIGF
jgi:transcriptional regulator with XRE-family HTH domain